MINAKEDAQPPEPASVAREDAPLAGQRAVRWALKQPAFWGLLIAFTVYYATFSGLGFHLYSLLLEQGFDTATVVAMLVLLGPSQVAGRIAVWGIAERASVRAIGKVVALDPTGLDTRDSTACPRIATQRYGTDTHVDALETQLIEGEDAVDQVGVLGDQILRHLDRILTLSGYMLGDSFRRQRAITM